jgi:hypothetical protein
MFIPCASDELSNGLKSWVKVTPTFASSYRAGPGVTTELLAVEEDDDDVVDDVLPHAATPRATPAATTAIFPRFI